MDIIRDLWSNHSYLLIPLVWMILTALLNLLFRKKSPEEWVEYAKKKPRLAALIRLCSALGLDLSKALIHVQKFVKAQDDATPKPPALAVVDKVLDAIVDKAASSDEEPKETPKETPRAKESQKEKNP